MALRAGASKVIFVEEGPIIEVARQAVTTAGFAEKAEFFQENSFELSLPERVDVVICDHVGYFGFDYNILSLLADARKRFLKPGGIIVPAQIELQLAPVESAPCRELVAKWRNGSVPDDYAWLGAAAANTKHAPQLQQQELLADAAVLATLKLGEEAAPFLSWIVEFRCARDGTLDGVAGWFDCQLFDDVHMTNSPAATDALKRPQAFLPLDTPVTISAGERIKVTVMARHLDNVLGWIVELPDSEKQYTHTTFNGLLLDREALMRTRPDRVAKLNDKGRARQIVLSYCDGERSAAEVQALVLREHPKLFPSEQATSAFVLQVLTWDTGE
jgi:protein arginine N-methyltransferase 1